MYHFYIKYQRDTKVTICGTTHDQMMIMCCYLSSRVPDGCPFRPRPEQRQHATAIQARCAKEVMYCMCFLWLYPMKCIKCIPSFTADTPQLFDASSQDGYEKTLDSSFLDLMCFRLSFYPSFYLYLYILSLPLFHPLYLCFSLSIHLFFSLFLALYLSRFLPLL